MTHPSEYTWFADLATEESEMTKSIVELAKECGAVLIPADEDDEYQETVSFGLEDLLAFADALLKQELDGQEAAKPYAYAGEYDVDNIRDMRTVVFRELSGFETESKQPDAIYPLYRGEKL
jgi:hypothetical protein